MDDRLQRVTGVPIGRVRVTIEISVLVIGVLLGGTFDMGLSCLHLRLVP